MGNSLSKASARAKSHTKKRKPDCSDLQSFLTNDSVFTAVRSEFQEIPQNDEHAHQACCIAENTISCDSVYQITNHTAYSHYDDIRDLGGNMVYMMALGTRRRQNGGIGNWGHMVAAYRTGENCRHSHNHEMGIIRYNSQNDRNQDPEPER